MDAGLIEQAKAGALTKQALVSLLPPEKRSAFLAACARIERPFTDACASQHDPCLESGCSCEADGEICLQPLIRDEAGYQQACGAEFVKLLAMT